MKDIQFVVCILNLFLHLGKSLGVLARGTCTQVFTEYVIFVQF
jgi:hypothetical protein